MRRQPHKVLASEVQHFLGPAGSKFKMQRLRHHLKEPVQTHFALAASVLLQENSAIHEENSSCADWTCLTFCSSKISVQGRQIHHNLCQHHPQVKNNKEIEPRNIQAHRTLASQVTYCVPMLSLKAHCNSKIENDLP